MRNSNDKVPRGPQQRDKAGIRCLVPRQRTKQGTRWACDSTALFRSHPEFSGEVRDHVIAPGRLLVVAEPEKRERRGEDPVLRAFLSFLAQDMQRRPQQIRPLDNTLMAKIASLVRGVRVSPEEDLGDESLL